MSVTNRTAFVISEGIAAVHIKKERPFWNSTRCLYKLHGVTPRETATLTSFSLTSQVVGDTVLVVRGGTVLRQIGMEQW